MRLINADALGIGKANPAMFENNSYANGWNSAIEILEQAPTVDAEPVRHGRWSYKWDAERDPKRLFVRIVCSECNLHTGQKSNYCPNCGAKMDRKEESP